MENDIIEKIDLPEDLIALVDGDELLYKVGFASQHVWYYIYDGEGNTGGDGFVSKFPYMKQALAHCKENPTHDYKKELEVETEDIARSNLKLAIKTILDDIKTNKCRIFLNGETNFRDELATIKPYKGNRDDSKKPVHFDFIKKLLLEEYFSEVVEGYESDDAMSINQREDTIICTQDKDLDNIGGFRYNSNRREIYKISEVEGMRSFYGQLVQGDATDNIPGIAGIGKVTAKKLFQSCNTPLECFKIARLEYQKAFKKLDKNPLFVNKDIDEVMLEIGNLLWMKRSEDDMWTPPKEWEISKELDQEFLE